MPEQFVEWADEHRELMEMVVGLLARTGNWPLLTDLTRDFVRIGKPTRVEAIFFDMPQPLRFRTGYPERAVLSLFGLRLTEGAGPLLAGFYETLALARKRYQDDDDPFLTSNDVGQVAALSRAHPSALIEIVEREAPFLGSSTPQSSPDVWVREVSTAIVNYWSVETIDDFLRLRVEELRLSPMWHWPALDQKAAMPAGDDTADEQRLSVFISHASEDKAAVAQPIAEGLQAAGWKVWLDRYELTVGDRLFERISDGLASSQCGVVVLSESFFAKHWPKQELEALAAKESASGGKVILPVWHGIDEVYLAREAPMLANRLGVSTHAGIPHVIEQLTRALTKELGSDTTLGKSKPVFRSARTSETPQAPPAKRQETSTATDVPILVLAPPSQHRLDDPQQVAPPPQVIWAQSVFLHVENVGTAVAFIKSGGADPIGSGSIVVKPPTAIAPGATRPVELVVDRVTQDARLAAGQLIRFWLDYGSASAPDRRLWAVAQYNAGGGWMNVGSDNRPLE